MTEKMSLNLGGSGYLAVPVVMAERIIVDKSDVNPLCPGCEVRDSQVLSECQILRAETTFCDESQITLK